MKSYKNLRFVIASKVYGAKTPRISKKQANHENKRADSMNMIAKCQSPQLKGVHVRCII